MLSWFLVLYQREKIHCLAVESGHVLHSKKWKWNNQHFEIAAWIQCTDILFRIDSGASFLPLTCMLIMIWEPFHIWNIIFYLGHQKLAPKKENICMTNTEIKLWTHIENFLLGLICLILITIYQRLIRERRPIERYLLSLIFWLRSNAFIKLREIFSDTPSEILFSSKIFWGFQFYLKFRHLRHIRCLNFPLQRPSKVNFFTWFYGEVTVNAPLECVCRPNLSKGASQFSQALVEFHHW